MIGAVPIPIRPHDPDVAALIEAHSGCCHMDLIYALSRYEAIARALAAKLDRNEGYVVHLRNLDRLDEQYVANHVHPTFDDAAAAVARRQTYMSRTAFTVLALTEPEH